jgi:hypothetical protein
MVILIPSTHNSLVSQNANVPCPPEIALTVAFASAVLTLTPKRIKYLFGLYLSVLCSLPLPTHFYGLVRREMMVM